MSDDWFNPTFKTRDGEELSDYEPGNGRPAHQDPELLRRFVDAGWITVHIAQELGVSTSTIHRQMQAHDIPRPDREPEAYNQLTREIHNEVGLEWAVNQYGHDGEGRVERMADGGHDLGDGLNWLGEMHECPDCGWSYPTEKGQHDCMRGHAREMADEMESEMEVLI